MADPGTAPEPAPPAHPCQESHHQDTGRPDGGFPDIRAGGGRLAVALDGAVAVGLLVALSAGTGPRTGLPAWVGPVVLAALALPLAVRRRWPGAVFAVVVLATLAAAVVGMGRAPLLAAAYAAYPLAVSRPARRWARGHVPLHLAGLAAGLLVLGGPPAPVAGSWLETALFGVLAVGASWGVGRAVRERRELAAEAAQRLAERAVTAERLRIARELHDVVAHSISVIAVKAGVANHVLAARPEEAADALRVIEGASRAALTELRQLLGVLRSGDTDAPVELGPTPGVADVPALAARAADAGARVELDLPDAAATRGLPEGVELSAFRIVQEALTNVIKHAGPVRCRVSVRLEPDAVRVEVVDDGAGRGPAGPAGHGLIGMRERVAVHGGRLRVGPEPDGGFAVRAELPVAALAEPR